MDDDVAVTPNTVRGAAAAIGRADVALVTFEPPAAAIRATIKVASRHSVGVFVQPVAPLDDPAGPRKLPD